MKRPDLSLSLAISRLGNQSVAGGGGVSLLLLNFAGLRELEELESGVYCTPISCLVGQWSPKGSLGAPKPLTLPAGALISAPLYRKAAGCALIATRGPVLPPRPHVPTRDH